MTVLWNPTRRRKIEEATLTVEAFEDAKRPGTFMACARDEAGWMWARTYGHPSAESARREVTEAVEGTR